MRCSICALVLSEWDHSRGFCCHHLSEKHSEWSDLNRMACNFFHRGIEAPKSSLQFVRSEDGYWYLSDD